MTVIIAMAVHPSNGENSYILFGSDSLQVNYRVDGEERIALSYDHNQQKIFKLHNYLVSFAGSFDVEVIFDMLEFLEEHTNEKNCLDDITEIAIEYFEYRMLEGAVINNAVMFIGRISSEGKPTIAYFEIEEQNYSDVEVFVIEANDNQRFGYVTAGKPVPDELTYTLRDEINPDDNVSLVEGIVEKFLLGVAKSHPEECNEIIKFKYLP